MSAQTTEGTGPGSVDRVKQRILNGDVKAVNLTPDAIEAIGGGGSNVYSEILASNGTESSMDGSDLLIKGGDGYEGAEEEDDADGGNVTISGGTQHGDGNSGDVLVKGGDSSTDFDNADAGDITIRGGDGIGPGDSDGGDVTLRGGDCGAAGSEGEAGDVNIRGGNSTGSQGGNVDVFGGDSGTNGEDGDSIGGTVTIRGGQGGGPTAKGGDVSLMGGYGGSHPGYVLFGSIAKVCTFAGMGVLNANVPQPEDGMFCYVEELNSFVVRVNGAWVTLNTSPIAP